MSRHTSLQRAARALVSTALLLSAGTALANGAEGAHAQAQALLSGRSFDVAEVLPRLPVAPAASDAYDAQERARQLLAGRPVPRDMDRVGTRVEATAAAVETHRAANPADALQSARRLIGGRGA